MMPSGSPLPKFAPPRRQALGDAVAHERRRRRPARRDAHPAADGGAADQRPSVTRQADMVRKTSPHSTLEFTALTWISSSTAISNSPMPNNPMTATIKLTPLHQFVDTHGQADATGHGVDADRRQGEADGQRHQRLESGRAAHADEAREGEQVDREIFGRAELQRHLGDPRGGEGDQHDADQGAESCRPESGGERGTRLARRGPSDSRRRWSPPMTARLGC